MSVLVAIKEKNRVVIGTDVRMSAGDAYVDSYQRRPKALHLNDNRDVIVAGVGNIGLVDVLRQQLNDYIKKDLYAIDRAFLVKYVVPGLITDVRNYELTDKDGKMDGVLLLAIKDKAFIITGNYSVEEVIKYDAEGSGRDAALGSLYTTSKMTMKPEEKIIVAIEAAGSCVNTVSKVSYIGDTAGMQFLPTNVENNKR